MPKTPILEICSEITAGTRGSSLGPKAIRAVSRSLQDGFFQGREVIEVQDQNNALDQQNLTPFAKHIESYKKIFDQNKEKTQNIFQEYDKCIVLSGDHGNAAGVIQGLRTAHPTQKMGLIWIDAHADIHSPYTTPSGNMHGMPISIVLAENNLGKQQNTPSTQAITLWEQMQKIKSNSQVQLIYIGVRDTEEPEDYIIQKRGIENLKVEQVHDWGVQKTTEKIKATLSDCDYIYISFDVDSLDPEKVSFGTGTPVKNGLDFDFTKSLVRQLIAELNVKVFECTEVNPLLDNKTNLMAEKAYEMVKMVDEIL